MYEKLDKLRAEVERARQRVEDDRVRLRAAEDKLKEEENKQILADVGALNLKPEQLAEFLKLAAGGKLPTASRTNAYGRITSHQETEDTDDDDNDDTEETQDEEN